MYHATQTPLLKVGVQVWQELMSATHITVVSHSRPDGDAIGSQLALAELLWAQGKEVTLVNRDGVPETFRFLAHADRIQHLDRIPGTCDVAVFIECADISRSEIAGYEACRIINIDHHDGNTFFGHLNWVDPDAPCVGCMLLDLQEHLDLPAPPAFYDACYVALISDSGNFSYNLTARTFRTALRLVEHGVNAQDLFRRVFANLPDRKYRLLREVLGTLGRSPDGRIAWLWVTEQMLKETGTTVADTDGFVDFALRLAGVEVALLLKECTPGEFRISIRSNGRVDVLRIAEAFGGGGHRYAAAFPMQGNLDQILERLVDHITEQHLAQLTSADLDESVPARPLPEKP